MFRVVCLVIGYFIGCLQFSFIIGKLFYKIDIREFGSGNAGSTNAVRTMGAKTGLIVFFLDVFKAAGAFMLAAVIFHSHSVFTPGASNFDILPGFYCAFGVIIGHIFPFYLDFKGGKGMACACGAILFIDAWLAWPLFVFAIGIIAVTKYVSAASLVFTALVPVMLLAFGYGLEAAAVGIGIAALCWYKHKGNIKRLMKGTERKFNFKKSA